MRSASALALVLSLALSVSVIAGCAGLTQGWQAPEVALAGLEPREIALASQTFLVTLAVKNPNDRTLPVKAMTYRVQIEGDQLAEGSSRLDRQIPAHGSALVDLEVKGNLLAAAQYIPELALGKRPIHWTVSGTVTLADGFLTLPYRYSGQVDPALLLGRLQR